MTWRLARSLETLRAQVNDLAPDRSKLSDGTVSSTAHRRQNPTSDHDPDGAGVVRALDLTHDPKAGFDAHAFADRLLAAQDARLKYLISDGRIGSGPSGRAPGVWRRYDGPNSHTKHVHVSVVGDYKADLVAPWVIGPTASIKPTPEPDPVQEDCDMTFIICLKERTNWVGNHATGVCRRISADSMAVARAAGQPFKEIDSEAAMKNALALP